MSSLRQVLVRCLLSASLGAIAVAILFSPGGSASTAAGAVMGAVSGLAAELLVWRTSPRLDTVALGTAERHRVSKLAALVLAIVAVATAVAFLATGRLQTAFGTAFLGILCGTLYLSWQVRRITADR